MLKPYDINDSRILFIDLDKPQSVRLSMIEAKPGDYIGYRAVLHNRIAWEGSFPFLSIKDTWVEDNIALHKMITEEPERWEISWLHALLLTGLSKHKVHKYYAKTI